MVSCEGLDVIDYDLVGVDACDEGGCGEGEDEQDALGFCSYFYTSWSVYFFSPPLLVGILVIAPLLGAHRLEEIRLRVEVYVDRRGSCLPRSSS